MKQFNLSEWLEDKSRKVMTRRGNPVRIICIDRKHGKDELPIVFLEENNGGEFLLTCRNDGRSDNYDTQYDLFFADEEEELTEFENTMVSFAHAMFDHLLDVTKEVNIKEWKDTLLDLAKKKLRKEQQEKLGTLEMPIDVTEPYYIKGKQDALKDLESLIEDKVAEKFAELLKDLQTQSPLQPNPYNPNPFQPTTVLYGCPSTFPDITYSTKTQ